jgi:hypothetical protein
VPETAVALWETTTTQELFCTSLCNIFIGHSYGTRTPARVAALGKANPGVPQLRFSRGPTRLRHGTDCVCTGQASSGATLTWATGVILVFSPLGVGPVESGHQLAPGQTHRPVPDDADILSRQATSDLIPDK